jgi:hypothetical protein
MSMNEQTRSWLDRIHQVIEKRQKTYGKVMLGLALSRNEKNELRVCYALLNFLSNKSSQSEEKAYDYGNLLLIKKFIEVPEALTAINNIFEKEIIKVDDRLEIPIKARLSELHFVPSSSFSWGYVSSGFASMLGYFDIDANYVGRIPFDALAKFDLPVYPNGQAAVVDFLQLKSVTRRDYGLNPRIELLIPDYRARIKNLRLAGKKVSIEAEGIEMTLSDLAAKFYCETETKAYTSDIIPVENGQASYVVEKEPTLVQALLFSRLDKDPIDSKSFDYRNPRSFEGIIIESIEAQLIDIIKRGEGINVEFKPGLVRENYSDFMETVVSFANTSGGIIFLGVDDKGRVSGFEENVTDTVTNLIADYCEPSIEPQIESRVPIKDKVVTLVRVPEGENKPYMLRDRGIIVRRGSTDRQITRIELDDIYESRKQQGDILVGST